MSGGVESERDREVGSRRSGLGLVSWASWVNTGWLDDWVGVVGGGVESPEAAEKQKDPEEIAKVISFSLDVRLRPRCYHLVTAADTVNAVTC